jgi:hypothetical protein
MTMNKRVLVCLVFGATIVLGTPFLSAASAQCPDVTEYVEMWDDSDELNDMLGLYARGVAQADQLHCDLTVRTYIQGPSGTELASAYGYGSSQAMSQVVIYLDGNSPQGTYAGKTEAWSGGVHFGCSAMFPVVSIVIAPYIRTWVGENWCSYIRCSGSQCQQVTAKKSAFGGACPPFAVLTLVRLNFGVFAICWGHDGYPISSCEGEEEENLNATDSKETPNSELSAATGRHCCTTRAIGG